MAKEAYIDCKRGLHRCQKRPTKMAKEAYIDGKRGLHRWQKRPVSEKGLRDQMMSSLGTEVV
jgi:hypothetical protein